MYFRVSFKRWLQEQRESGKSGSRVTRIKSLCMFWVLAGFIWLWTGFICSWPGFHMGYATPRQTAGGFTESWSGFSCFLRWAMRTPGRQPQGYTLVSSAEPSLSMMESDEFCSSLQTSGWSRSGSDSRYGWVIWPSCDHHVTSHTVSVSWVLSAWFYLCPGSDSGSVCVLVLSQVLKALQLKYGSLYHRQNVVLSGTHTHCGPGGYFQYTLFMMSTKGYIKSSIRPLVDAIVKVKPH